MIIDLVPNGYFFKKPYMENNPASTIEFPIKNCPIPLFGFYGEVLNGPMTREKLLYVALNFSREYAACLRARNGK